VENVSINDKLYWFEVEKKGIKNREEMENWRMKNFFVWLKRKMRI